jgi:hypothetical protein
MMRVVRWLLLLAMTCGCALTARADDEVIVCYNYGCSAQATVRFSSAQIKQVVSQLAAARDAAEERRLVSRAIGQLYAWAGEQSPIHADRAGNYADGGVNGEMDCIDHSTTTTRFLRLLEQSGALHFHRVGPVIRRGWLFQHFTATLDELPSSASPATAVPTAAPAASRMPRYAVDSWFVDNGQPAVVLPLIEWFSYRGDSGV